MKHYVSLNLFHMQLEYHRRLNADEKVSIATKLPDSCVRW